MSTGRASAVGTLLAVSAGVLSWLAFAGCGKWDECTAPKPVVLEQARAATDTLNLELDAICADPRLQPMYQRSPCASSAMDSPHMSDSAAIADKAALVRLHSRSLTEAIQRLTGPGSPAQGNSRNAKLAQAYVSWDRQRVASVEALLAKNPTWGELNRERRRLGGELRVALAQAQS